MNARVRGFSQRSISTKLGWPVSYLPDLMKKRKTFTIKRAIEFGNYFDLNPIDFEKLIYLSITDSGLIKNEDMQKIVSTKSQVRYKPTEDFELLSASTFLIFESVRWLQGKATLQVLIDLALKKDISADLVLESVRQLTARKLIEKKGNEYRVMQDFLMSDDYGPANETIKKFHQQFSMLQHKYFEDPIGPGFYNSAIVHIERSRYDEIVNRMAAFRNWIFEISKKDAKLPQKDDVRLFQFDINLTALFEKNLCKKLREEQT